ncbi:hypothetical protein QMA04_00275 [Planococcus sp. APC 3900]|uniref:hypothetical protein n=1 Tax=Planococcus sp. APC 3900 TaxID=3035191 RepID=UPI0025B4A37E|nr:hypothetical protein [Planococcus sp. APC 3900]MDN3436500.1 hypothetical protein [Planococcus sp. APC 3900]
MGKKKSDKKLLTENHFTPKELGNTFLEAGRLEIRLPAYHLNHEYIEDAQKTIAKIPDLFRP